MKPLDIKKERRFTCNPESNPFKSKIVPQFEFYLKTVKPLVIQVSKQPLTGPYGLNTHTDSVVFRAIDFALSLQQNPVPAIFAAALHDIAHANDETASNHGAMAVVKSDKIMKQFPDLLSGQTRNNILHAIVNHQNGKIALDYISSCLWDADRIPKAWAQGFDPAFFNTPRGKYVAQHWKQYIEFQKLCFPNIAWSRNY